MSKELNSPLAEGGKGPLFEAHVQASFLILMLSGGNVPGLPGLPLKEIILQGKNKGYETDDLIVIVENSQSKYKLLGQVKHKISFTKSDPKIGEVLQAAWNDFNNEKIFNKTKDIIALITGPISKTDYHTVKWILDQARSVNTIEELIRRSELAKFSPSKSIEKLNVIKNHLKKANGGLDVDDELFLLFLKRFYLFGYDLGDREGVIISYLFSHLSQFGLTNQRAIWSEAVEFVQSMNQYAGIISNESIPDDLKAYFEIKKEKKIPQDLNFVKEKLGVEIAPLNQKEDKEKVFLALATLVGSWNESYENDIKVLIKNLNYTQQEWDEYSRGFLRSAEFVKCDNKKWKFSNRVEILEQCGDYLFDNHIENLLAICFEVFGEISPEYDLKPEDRFSAPIFGKVSIYSKELRKGLSDGLAILSNNQELFKNFSKSKIDIFSYEVVKKLFSSNNWKHWATLNSYIPILAEVNPVQFLKIIDEKASPNASLIQSLFKQENSDLIRAENYLTGILWGLESLAWKKDLLVNVCVCLGSIANIDPGGSSANRAINSLIAILLPWYPQTIASIDKRKAAINSLLQEFPDVLWKLVLALLPGNHQTTMGTSKPKWMKVNFPSENVKVSSEEYFEQVNFYADIAVNLAACNIDKELELIKYFGRLPEKSFDEFLNLLILENAVESQNKNRIKIWEELTKLISKHKSYSGSDWSMSKDLVEKLNSAAKSIAPSNPISVNKKFFSERDSELFEERFEWNELQEKLEKLRTEIIVGFLNEKGIDFVLRFAEEVKRPELVGSVLAKVSDQFDIDKFLIPKFLEIEKQSLKTLISSFVYNKWREKGYEWCDFDRSSWSIEQKANFLTYLPFSSGTWELVDSWLPDNSINYWKSTFVTSIAGEDEYQLAVKNLLRADRPVAAMDCLDGVLHVKNEVDINLVIQSLKDTVHSNESKTNMDSHNIINLIQYLQKNKNVSTSELFDIECAYLTIFNPHQGIRPIAIENTLANNAEFFCSLIQSIYRSRKTGNNKKTPTEKEKNIAKNAWSILNNWRTVPGTQNDGTFSELKFEKWIEKAKKICEESGHYKVGFITIGEVLYHSPTDKSGLWINKIIASTLNKKQYKHLRQGYVQGAFNSRGAFWTDSTGSQEKQLSEIYNEKGDSLEEQGFSRFASSLKSLAKSYAKQADDADLGVT